MQFSSMALGEKNISWVRKRLISEDELSGSSSKELPSHNLIASNFLKFIPLISPYFTANAKAIMLGKGHPTHAKGFRLAMAQLLLGGRR